MKKKIWYTRETRTFHLDVHRGGLFEQFDDVLEAALGAGLPER